MTDAVTGDGRLFRLRNHRQAKSGAALRIAVFFAAADIALAAAKNPGNACVEDSLSQY